MRQSPTIFEARTKRFFGILALAILTPISAAAASETPPLPDEVARLYVGPHDRIDIGGRTLNLHCMGSGDRTILFDSGGSDWSVIWALVQPKVAENFRACSYDRAGLGYSDPAMLPRTPGAIVEDMHKLIGAGKLKTPLILVGHSLGGFNVKLYAALYPHDVAALVLVDPAEERQSERGRAFLTAKYDRLLVARAELTDQAWLGWLLERYRECVRLGGESAMDPASITYRRCSDPARPQLGPTIAGERQRIQVMPAYQRAQASEILHSVYGASAGDPVYKTLFKPGMFGSKPLIVLTHGDYDASDTLEAMDQAAMTYFHRETARLSRNGSQRTVEGASHNIEIDQPAAIVKAIEEVKTRLAARRR